MEPLQSPDFACSSCGTRLSSSRAVTASVLYPHGWEQRQHRSKRCLKSSCSLFGKRVWHNYLADKNGHWFHWRSPQAMEYFFLSHTWCVSTSWLRQISHRLVCFSLQEMVNFLHALQWRRVFLFICRLNFSTSKPFCMTLSHRYQYVSWYGEADVHKADAMSRGVGDLVPCKAWQKIFKAWLYWRFVSRRAYFLSELEKCF